MPRKKSDNLLEKIVKKDYNNELEGILEKKYFDENVKSLLLSMLYKIENAYNDYESVKQNVETKEEYMRDIVETIKNDCETIKTVKPHSEESKIIGNKTFLVERNKKRIICYPIERNLLYSVAKIGKRKKIIKDKYFVLNETLSDLINTGNNIEMVEPLRDFNGYSWTTITREIESIEYNLVYQNLRMLLGYNFIRNWIKNKEFIIDYMELYKNRLEEIYGKANQTKIVEIINRLSILLDIKCNSKIKSKIKKQKEEIQGELERLEDRKSFIMEITEQKRTLKEEIKRIDETVNNKSVLQEEYEKRNEHLPLNKKIFSIRILSKEMAEERKEKIEELEHLNDLLNPQKFIKYKKDLEKKLKYLVLKGDINSLILKLQKSFLECYKIKIMKAETKQELLRLIYEYRYYNLLPYSENEYIYEIKELKDKILETEILLIQKAIEMKLIIKISNNQDINNKLLKNIFELRIISLETLNVKIIEEKSRLVLQLFDEDMFEEKIEIENISKKDVEIKMNKKINLFNK